MDDDPYIDLVTQDRIITEAVRRGRRRRRRWRLMGAAGVLAVGAAGVASGLVFAGGPPGQRVTTVNPALAPTTMGQAAVPASSQSSAPAATALPPVSPCRSSQIRVSVMPYGYGMGAAAAQIIYTNTSAGDCSLEGYPGITVSNQSGTTAFTAKPTKPGTYLQNQNLGWSAPSPVAINLRPGARAVSFVGWDTGASLAPNGLSACVSGPWRESITLPANGGVIVSDGSFGLGVCGALQAEPIQPATYRPAP